MIKTLHITSIILGILTVSLMVFGVVFGGQDDEEADKILQSPSAIEKFEKGSSKRDPQSSSKTSPLVTEAKSFALYLNPPPKPKPKKRPTTKSKTKTKTRAPKTPVSAKFELVGTAYYPLSPKTSMALIDQPGKGLSWIRQGEEVNHLIFEKIKDGVVVIRDGSQTREMKTPARAEDQKIQQFMSSGSKDLKKADSKTGAISRGKISRPAAEPTVTPEQMKALQEVFSKVSKNTEEGAEPSESEISMLDEVFSSISKTRMNDNEANHLRALGETLEQNREIGSDDPNLEPGLESNFDPNLDANLSLGSVEPNSDPNINPNF
ncbi:MAG: hypothetical protein ACYSUK_01260 [Planctomycetota bacterium]|jgi:hypothetical protein